MPRAPPPLNSASPTLACPLPHPPPCLTLTLRPPTPLTLPHPPTLQVLPALEDAEKALASLNKNDIGELKTFTKPPPLVQVRPRARVPGCACP